MSEPGNARSRRTRAALLDATRALVEREGVSSATMGAVADRAGVTRRSVYLHFKTRSELIGALFDHVAETEGLQQSLDQVWAAPTAADALARWGAHLARYHSRVLPVDRAFAQTAPADADAAAHRRRVRAANLASCTRLARRLSDEGVLADDWNVGAAADMLYALTNSDLVEALLVDRRWTQRLFSERIAALLQATFIGADDGVTSSNPRTAIPGGR
ncbi:MAG: TetR/AcrR family transcriptional regulator [Jatrophihabitans sp.]|uniref:TetR/AcrR family transcriptional regulator n=1 Tax=Jatrophihabitans sp. TaxID=1932789 RepID=UPI00390D5D31